MQLLALTAKLCPASSPARTGRRCFSLACVEFIQIVPAMWPPAVDAITTAAVTQHGKDGLSAMAEVATLILPRTLNKE